MNDALLDLGLLEYVKSGVISICTDAALSSCSKGMVYLDTTSICSLHNVHRLCENLLVNLSRLNPELADEFDKVDRFMTLAKKKHSRTFMKKHKIPEAKRSMNIFLKVRCVSVLKV